MTDKSETATAVADRKASPSKVEFALFAPYNEEAELISAFSDWEPVEMERGDDGYFRTSVELQDGTHAYKFRVRSKSDFQLDEWVEVVDPYATLIEDSAEQNGLVRIHEGRRVVDTYVWNFDNAPLPADHELVIYEMHIGDFVGDGETRGGYLGVVDRLDYLVDLGINAIELMPVTEFPGDHSWGYNPRYFFAAESSYGTPEDLKTLIDACHERGIRVLMDLVFNHSDSDSPLTQIDFSYWYHKEPKDPDNNWGPEFDYGKHDEHLDLFPARKFAGDVVRFWVEEYHIDGLRIDAVKQIGDKDFLTWLMNEAKGSAAGKPFYTIAEHIPDSPEWVGADGPMDGLWHDSFYHTLIGQLCGKGADLNALKGILDPRGQGYGNTVEVINYLTNHDHHHFMAEMSECNLFDEEAFERARLGTALVMTAVGVPLVWMGEEFGEYKPKSIEKTPLEWILLENENNRNLHSFYKGLIRLRKENPALHTANLSFFHEDADKGVLAYNRWNDEGSQVIVVANLSDHDLKDYTLPWPEAGAWHEWTIDYDTTIGGDSLTLSLNAHEARVFVR